VATRIDAAYGLIPVWTTPQGDRRYLLILHQKGHWAFPKGHAEAGETPLETARREVEEETGLTALDVVETAQFEEGYQFQQGRDTITKTVTYFLAHVHPTDNGEPPAITVQEAEVAQFRWCSCEEAQSLITFEANRRILGECEALCQSISL